MSEWLNRVPAPVRGASWVIGAAMALVTLLPDVVAKVGEWRDAGVLSYVGWLFFSALFLLFASSASLAQWTARKRQASRLTADEPLYDKELSQEVAALRMRLEQLPSIYEIKFAHDSRQLKLERDEAQRESEQLRSQVPAPSALKPEEKFEVDFLGTVWRNQGYDACNVTSHLLDEIVTRGKATRDPYLVALRDRWSDLRNRIDGFWVVIDPVSELTWGERTAALEGLCRSYASAVGWITDYIGKHPGEELSPDWSLAVWGALHEAFARQLAETLVTRSNYRQIRIVMKYDTEKIKPPSE